MKIRFIVSFMLIVLTITMLSCFVTSHDIHVDISCDDFMENPTSIRNDFTMEIGDKLYIELCSNPTTGFEWSYEMSGDVAVKEEDHDLYSLIKAAECLGIYDELIDNKGKTETPLLKQYISTVNRTTWCGKFASKFRGRRRALNIILSNEIVEAYNVSRKQSGKEQLATIYVEALPYLPKNIDMNRLETYNHYIGKLKKCS